jgi:hypothetical protein
VSAEAADQTGYPADGSKQRLATARLGGCESQFKLADLNGDGVLDAGETKYYNSSIRSEKQPVTSEDVRLDEGGHCRVQHHWRSRVKALLSCAD